MHSTRNWLTTVNTENGCYNRYAAAAAVATATATTTANILT